MGLLFPFKYSHAFLELCDETKLTTSENLQCENEFRAKLRQKISAHKELGYRTARVAMFTEIDNDDDEVCSVYGGGCIITKGIPDHTKMNCEHTWPRSRGPKGPAVSDLHHLFPTVSTFNSKRSSFPFCEVVIPKWNEDGSQLGYSKNSNELCFEPPDYHKGNVARAMFYYSVRYRLPIDEAQEAFLRKWNDLDPVDQGELARNESIFKIQKNRNPFIDNSDLAENIRDF